MSNALNPFMAGRQMGVSRPYAQIKAGGGMSPAQFNALNLSNTINPRQVQLVQSQFQNIDPASDVRRQYVEDRSDLRQNMINQANALEGDKQRKLQAQEGDLNRKATEKLTEAQLRNAIALEDLRITGRKDLETSRQEFELKREDKRLANSLELAGVDAENAKELAKIRGGFQMAATTAELKQRASEARERFAIMRKELAQKKAEAQKDRENILQGKAIDQAGATSRAAMEIEARTNIADLDRTAMLQNTAIQQAGQTGRTAMQIEMAEQELAWQEKMFNAEHKLAQDRFNQQTTDRAAFGKNVGQVMDEYNKWKSSGMQAMREDLRDNWVQTTGLSFALANPNIFEKVLPAGKTVTIPMRSGRSKELNQEWVDTLMANLDPSMSAHFEQNVEQVVRQRDSDFFGLLSRYMGVAASGGLPFNPTPNALQPPQTGNSQTAPVDTGLSDNASQFLQP